MGREPVPVMVSEDVYKGLLEDSIKYRILTRTLLRTSRLNVTKDHLLFNEYILEEILKSCGAPVEITIANLKGENNDE